jgi:hypothetical protein
VPCHTASALPPISSRNMTPSHRSLRHAEDTADLDAKAGTFGKERS